MNKNVEKLNKYLESIGGDENLLQSFLVLMEKQQGEKPVHILNGLSIYRQANSSNYYYRVHNKEWDINERKSCGTPDKERARNFALKVWARYEVMFEFNLIKKDGETFIQFAERVVIPSLEEIKARHNEEAHACKVPQRKKQIKQKALGINKRIQHLRIKCEFLHDKPLSDLKPKDFEDFASYTLSLGQISSDTFTNYMTVVRDVLTQAVSQGVITTKPDTTLNKMFKDLFTKKVKGTDIPKQDRETIFRELEEAIKVHEENVTESKTAKYSKGKLLKLKSYLYYLKFILLTGTRAGDECFVIKWSDFDIKHMGKDAKGIPDYYCTIRGGKIESLKAEGRRIIISKGNEDNRAIFIECLSPLAELQGFKGGKDAIESKSNNYIFDKGLKDVQRYIKKYVQFSVEFIPYSFRHTYITSKILESNEPLDRIAKQCGNSVEIIQKNYNHATEERYRLEELRQAGKL